jgi:hypothetical protein
MADIRGHGRTGSGEREEDAGKRKRRRSFHGKGPVLDQLPDSAGKIS